jgi:acetyltransferase-like isoleucine patch superfamily enzyme
MSDKPSDKSLLNGSEENYNEVEPINFNFTFFIALFFLTAWINLFPSVLFGYWFFKTFPFQFSFPYLLYLIPLFFILYGIALLWSLITTKIGIWIVHKRITYPKQGSYPLSMDNPQTRAFIIKGNIKGIGRWLYYFFNLKFIRAFWMRQMGVKIGKNVKWGIYVQDEEFIEIGDNAFMAWNTILSGHLMDQHDLTINKTVIGKNCIFEHISGSVGGIVGDNSYFTHITGAMKGQICRGNAIYNGVPCKKIGEFSELTATDIEKIKQKIREIDRTNFIKQKNAPIKVSEAKLFLMKCIIVIGGILLGLLVPFLYSLLFQSLYSPTNDLWNILILALVPFIFLISMGFLVVGTTLFTKIFLVFYDKKGEIPEGTYELDDPRAKWFKIKYCLRMFGLRLFHATPFKLADSFVIRFWGNVKLARNVKLEDAIVDPQYLELGDFTQLAAGARVHTHDIIENKLYIKKVKIGGKVLIGSYAHLKPGVEIADGSVAAVAAWFRKNRICKAPALWLGKPAFELPLSMLTKSARLEGKYVD